jgi:hypothetical protein
MEVGLVAPDGSTAPSTFALSDGPSVLNGWDNAALALCWTWSSSSPLEPCAVIPIAPAAGRVALYGDGGGAPFLRVAMSLYDDEDLMSATPSPFVF